MYAKIHKHWHVPIAVLMLTISSFLAACRQTSLSTTTPLPTFQPSPTPAELPRFLAIVYPKPGQMIVQASLLFDSIWALLRLEEIAQVDETLDLEDIQERVEFLVDGERLDVRIDRGFRAGTSQITISRQVALSLGEHKATIRAHKTSGEILEYSWTFTVVAEEPTLPNLPEGFQFVRPLPDSVITLQAYREEHLIPPYHAPAFADLRGGICVGVVPGKIVKPGEFLDGTDVARKYPFIALDGTPPDTNTVIEVEYEPLEVEVRDKTTGRVVASYVGPHNYKCWRVELPPGEHSATVQLQKASGEVIEYTWRFTIMSD